MTKLLKLLLIPIMAIVSLGVINAAEVVVPAAAPPKVEAAGTGCTQGSLSVTDYYMEDGVMYPNTAVFKCHTTYNPGLWVRIEVTCSFGATLYSAWIKTIGQVSVSCGPGWGHLTSWQLKTKWV